MKTKVIKILGCALMLSVMLIGFQNCGGSGSGSGGGSGAGSAGVTCGTGTHDNGSGVCAIDNALAIQNTTGNYWRCLVNSVGFLQFFADGTGQYHHADPPGILATTWSQTVGATDSITFTAGVNNFTFSNIVPNAPVGKTFSKMLGASLHHRSDIENDRRVVSPEPDLRANNTEPAVIRQFSSNFFPVIRRNCLNVIQT